jgi:hypothetical protein
MLHNYTSAETHNGKANIQRGLKVVGRYEEKSLIQFKSEPNFCHNASVIIAQVMVACGK